MYGLSNIWWIVHAFLTDLQRTLVIHGLLHSCVVSVLGFYSVPVFYMHTHHIISIVYIKSWYLVGHCPSPSYSGLSWPYCSPTGKFATLDLFPPPPPFGFWLKFTLVLQINLSKTVMVSLVSVFLHEYGTFFQLGLI